MKTTKEYILFESFKLFLVDGYDKVSMNNLVKVSGLSKGAFYHYFNSKEELFREAITEFFLRAMDTERWEPSTSSSLRDNLLSIVSYKAKAHTNLITLVGEQTENSGFFTLIFQAVRMFPEFREALLTGNACEEEMLAAVFRMAQVNGEIDPALSPAVLASMYSAMLDGMELHAVIGGSLKELQSAEAKSTENFIELICGTKR